MFNFDIFKSDEASLCYWVILSIDGEYMAV